MQAACINPFVGAAFSVLEATLGIAPRRGTLAMRPRMFTTQQCNVMLGVTGGIAGSVIYGMSLVTADKIASAMLGQPVRTFDALAASAIGELGNMITGQAMTQLSEAGYICDTTPPSIIRGTDIKLTLPLVPTVVIPIEMELGSLELIIGVQERK